LFLLWALILGLLIGFLRRGNLGNLARIELKGVWLILAALVIQILIFPLGSSAPLVQIWTEALHMLSYAFLLAFIVLNHRHLGLLIMGAGLVSNILVISVNGGYMPASTSALRNAGMENVAQFLEQNLRHGNTVLMSAHTNLNFLGDLFSVPASVPFATAFSIGDLLLALGIIVFLAMEMPAHRPQG